MPEFVVENADDQLSVSQFLQRKIPAAPQAYLNQLLKKGRVKTDQGPCQATDLLSYGELVRLPDTARLQELMQQAPALAALQPSQILYESRDILIVDKPAGLAVHASEGHQQNNLTAQVSALLRQRGERFQVAPVQRLDLETSGPVLFGKGKKAAGALGKLLMNRQVKKTYLALVSGKTAGSGRLEGLLRAKGKEKSVCSDFFALARNDQASLLELLLHTGRQHQIRRQLTELGHPLYGDRRYGGPCPESLPRMFLHCHKLEFVDPFSAAAVAINSPLPAALATFLSQLGLSQPCRSGE